MENIVNDIINQQIHANMFKNLNQEINLIKDYSA